MSKKKEQIFLLQKDYSWEELSDLERDVYEAVEYNDYDIPGEYEGTIRVTMEYIEEE